MSAKEKKKANKAKKQIKIMGEGVKCVIRVKMSRIMEKIS